MMEAGLSLATRKGLELLAAEIRASRARRGWSEQELADRLGASRKTVRAIEAARTTVAIGFVFEAAHLVGLDLFGGGAVIDARLAEAKARLTLLPQRVRNAPPEISDDF